MRANFQFTWKLYKWLFGLSNLVLFFVGLYYSRELYQEVYHSFEFEKVGLYILAYAMSTLFFSFLFWLPAVIIIGIIHTYHRLRNDQSSYLNDYLAADSALSSQVDEQQESIN